MKNTWKGLVVGGLTGVGAGLVLDGLSRVGERAGSAGRKVKDRAPEVAEKLRERAPDIAGKLKDVDVSEAAHRLADRAHP